MLWLVVALAVVSEWCVGSEAYLVRRNVKDYGAKGDGVTDDTMSLFHALTDGRSFKPSTATPALLYFPSGVYLVTGSLPLLYLSQMVGEEGDWPVIKMRWNGTSDVRLIEAEGAWYPDAPQNNFYHQVRNFVLDLTECSHCTAIHWQVAQATSLHNLYVKMGQGSTNQGIWMENGSGGFFSDLIFEGGQFGLWIGNQQFTSRNITIRGSAQSAIYLNWDWGWTFLGLNISDSPVGVTLGSGTGSVTLIDSTFTNVPTVVSTGFDTSSGANTVVLDNIDIISTGSTDVVVNKGSSVLSVTGTKKIKTWAQGHIWDNGDNTIQSTDVFSPPRSEVLAPTGAYFQKGRPYYDNMVDVTSLGIVGDGVTDNTMLLGKILLTYANKSPLFFPYGTYILSDTVYVPAGTRLMGEVWSIFMASSNITNGPFSNPANPQPLLRVGNLGEEGTVELSDFLFTTKGPQVGLKFIEWNVRDPPGQPGSCGMWDVHFRVGGAIGTGIEPSNCPAGNGDNAPPEQCSGTWGLLHVTISGSLYLENCWGWTADHDLDYGNQINVYNGRGFLCESRGPVWMYGTAMEHNLYYQYHLHNAQNVMMGMIQTETPYFQPSTITPFQPTHPSDPSYCTDDPRCNMAYALSIESSSNIYLYGAGLYSFFNIWDQSCLKTMGGPSCQLNIVQVNNSQSVYMYSLSTYGSINMLSPAMPYTLASQNNNTFCSTVAANLNLF